MANYKIADLVALSDEELMKAFGFDQKLKMARKELEELNKFTGDARSEAEEKVQRMLNPEIYLNELTWIADDIERKQRQNDPKAVPVPSDLMD
jgi:hypothetical protein